MYNENSLNLFSDNQFYAKFEKCNKHKNDVKNVVLPQACLLCKIHTTGKPKNDSNGMLCN